MKIKYANFENVLSFYIPGTIVIMFLMLAMCSEIFVRWVFNSSIIGIVEIVENALVVITFLCLPGIQRERAHVRMGLLIDRASGKMKSVLEILNLSFSFLICIVLIYPFTVAIIRFKSINEASYYLSIPLWLIGLSMPLGILFLCIRFGIQISNEAARISRFSLSEEFS